MDQKFIADVRSTFGEGESITLGAPILSGEILPEPLVRLPLAMLNRHGLVAGATGTGKTRTLQLMAEQLSTAGVPVFVADIKGDLSGLAVPGEPGAKIAARTACVGASWQPTGFPVEFLSLTGQRGAQLRASVSSFGPLLLAKVLGLNATQTSVLAMVFAYCDDRHLALLDMSDLRAVLQFLQGEGSAELAAYGGMSTQTVGVLLREMIGLEQQGAAAFFGEPEFDLDDLMRTTPDGRGVISVLELSDCQGQPALFSTFMMWMLGRLYLDLPEVGDAAKPKLVFFFDEAHLLFDDASKELLDQVELVVRLIRSKGVGIIFITQSPKDIPSDVLGQLGNRVQHALRAFTPDDEAAMRAAARTFRKTPWYDLEELLTTVGTGEAIVTVLTRKGSPTPPFATHLLAPQASMGPLDEAHFQRMVAASSQVAHYRQRLERESARESLEARLAPTDHDHGPIGIEDEPTVKRQRRPAKPATSELDRILKSRTVSNVGTQLVRSVLGIIERYVKRRVR